MADKVIVTNESALRAKYGATGLRAVKAAVRKLAAADRTRGLVTRYLAIDDAATMRKLKGRPVTSVFNCRQNKEAVDAVWKALTPDYLMILGSTDVVPHQDLRNPAYRAGDDDDAVAFGDLPYACEGPYSRDVTAFIGPTRVLSRLPDLTRASSPEYVLGLLATAAGWTGRPEREYQSYFGLSAEVWRGSTELSLTNLFGQAAALRLSPPDGPDFGKADLGARSHFINCHGARVDPNFYGQRGSRFPVALTSAGTTGKIAEGTIAAAECCYGGELYEAARLGLDLPICQSYLGQGAYGYMGSTTIAYGPADGNGAADVLTQQFLLHLLQGASVGHAALAAQQAYVEQTGQMDPVDLKTLAQFCAYGDPSVHPVVVASPTSVPKGTDAGVASRVARQERRSKMAMNGRLLLAVKPTAAKVATRARVPAGVSRVLRSLATEAGVPAGARFVPYRVKQKRAPGAGKSAVHAERYHVLVAGPAATGPAVRKVAVVAKEARNRIVGYRIYYAR